jgi:hypothetical protein
MKKKMEVRVRFPENLEHLRFLDSDGTYYGIKDGGIYEVEGDSGEAWRLRHSFGVLVYKEWCVPYEEFKIEMDEELFKL